MQKNMLTVFGILAGAAAAAGLCSAIFIRAPKPAPPTRSLELVRVPVRPEPGLSAEASQIGRYPIYEPTDTTLIREAFANAERLTMGGRK